MSDSRNTNIENDFFKYCVKQRNGFQDIIKTMINHLKIDVNMEQGFALRSAIENMNESTIKLLLETKANPNIVLSSGGYSYTTPLHVLMRSRPKNIQCLQFLIEANANLNAKDSSQDTALSLLAAYEYSDIGFQYIEKLIEAKADINLPGEDGKTPLMWAIITKNQNLKYCKLLLDNKALINKTDPKGRTALDYALNDDRLSHLAAIHLLLSHSAIIHNPVFFLNILLKFKCGEPKLLDCLNFWVTQTKSRIELKPEEASKELKDAFQKSQTYAKNLSFFSEIVANKVLNEVNILKILTKDPQKCVLSYDEPLEHAQETAQELPQAIIDGFQEMRHLSR